jgi:hypothetical protein
MMVAPILNNWRLIAGTRDFLGILIGEVTGHPLLPDGWITTSAVSEIAQDRSWACTASRRYDLGAPLPDDQRLPPMATEAILSRLCRDAGTLPNVDALGRLVALAEELSEAPVNAVADKSS